MTSNKLHQGSGWIDSHCHLNEIGNYAEYVEQANLENIHSFIIPSVEQKQWPQLDALDNSIFYKAYGTHPWFVESPHQEAQVLAEILHQQSKSKVTKAVAVGEIGLDFFKGRTVRPEKSLQLESFELQLHIAKEFNLPVILHCVKAQNDMLAICKKVGITQGVVHGFSGSTESAEAFLSLGLSLGMGPMILKSPKTLAAFKNIPLNKIVLETDAPFMVIEKNGNPLLELVTVAQLFSQAVDIDLDVFQRQVFENTQALFKLTRA